MKKKKSPTSSSTPPILTSVPDSSISPAAVPPPAVGRDQIAERAYELWLEQGCPEGRDLDNWLEAERQLHATTLHRGLPHPPKVPDDSEGTEFADRVEERLNDIAEPRQQRSSTSLEP